MDSTFTFTLTAAVFIGSGGEQISDILTEIHINYINCLEIMECDSRLKYCEGCTKIN